MVGETGDVVDPRNAAGGTLVQRTSRLLLLTVALGGTLSATAAAQDPIPGRSPGGAPLRIAVGPFTNITGAEDDAWVGAGIAETLRVELELAGFNVVARDPVTPPMEADLAVTGGYQRVGDRIRTSVTLTEVRTGQVVRSITIDGVSLTVNDVRDRPDGSCDFALNLIPHTGEVTTLGDLREGSRVNLEIDVLARYLQRMRALDRA